MAVIVLIVSVGILGAITALVLHRKGKTPPVSNRDPSPDKTFLEAAPDESLPGERNIQGSLSILTGHDQTSAVYKDLKAYLKNGLDSIFDEDAPAPEVWSLPRTPEESDQHVLKDALERSPGLNRFRTEQLRLQKLLNDPSVQMPDLSRLIVSDPVMTAKVLKMANSSYFGVTQKIDSISHALMILGLQNIKNTLYREGVRDLFGKGSTSDREAVYALWKHSNLTCVCAQHFHDLFDGLNRGTLYTLGLVHDIGKLILMDYSRAGKTDSSVGEEYPPDIRVGEEDKLFGVNHAVIGGYTLAHWNFSGLMVNAVNMHHTPSFLEADEAKLSPEVQKYVLVLFLADQVARLYADWNEGIAHIYVLRRSYHPLIDRKKLLNKILDTGFLTQMSAAQKIADDEHHRHNT